jgi:hypothetical protein
MIDGSAEAKFASMRAHWLVVWFCGATSLHSQRQEGSRSPLTSACFAEFRPRQGGNNILEHGWRTNETPSIPTTHPRDLSISYRSNSGHNDPKHLARISECGFPRLGSNFALYLIRPLCKRVGHTYSPPRPLFLSTVIVRTSRCRYCLIVGAAGLHLLALAVPRGCRRIRAADFASLLIDSAMAKRRRVAMHVSFVHLQIHKVGNGILPPTMIRDGAFGTELGCHLNRCGA